MKEYVFEQFERELLKGLLLRRQLSLGLCAQALRVCTYSHRFVCSRSLGLFYIDITGFTPSNGNRWRIQLFFSS